MCAQSSAKHCLGARGRCAAFRLVQVFAGEEARKKEEAARGVERFVSEVAHAGREMLQATPLLVQRRRKQRNDAVLMWHQRQKQRATRAERLRVQALKAGQLLRHLRHCGIEPLSL